MRGAKYVVGVRTSEAYVFQEIYKYHQYERHPDFVPQRGWTVFDVGANIGVFTVQQAAKGANVYSFEPNPDAYRRLSRNVSANELADRVHLSVRAWVNTGVSAPAMKSASAVPYRGIGRRET